MPSWYVIHCRPLKECQTANILEQRFPLKTYVPMVQQRFRRKIQTTPLFPRYFFVWVNLKKVAPGTIQYTPGVNRIVSFGEEPASVPMHVIELLMEQEERIAAQGGFLDHHFMPGDIVRMTEGPLSGIEAIFEGSMEPAQRVFILLEFIGRLQKLEVDAFQIEKTSRPPQPEAIAHTKKHRRTRTTRGKGRKIKQKNPY